MPSAAAALTTPSGAEALERLFLAATRQRFKAEVNRMTGGAMRTLLGEDADDLAFLLSYVHALHWLRRNVHPRYLRATLAPFRSGSRAFLMDLLADADGVEDFVRGYAGHLLASSDPTLRERQQLQRLLDACGGDTEPLVRHVLSAWRRLERDDRTYAEAYRDIAREERDRYTGMLGPEDRERLALVDSLPDVRLGSARFDKLGVIPAMGCPQTCRHCMFVWRPPMRKVPDAAGLFQVVAAHTESVLFTGGDLTRHLEHFVRAIGAMKPVRTFAILLNGDFADDPAVTDATLRAMAEAIRRRPSAWPQAQVLLQISFDEFHQEVIADKDGRLRERIPVAKIANIVECAPRYAEIQLCLVHKQSALNFSMDLFRQGVFGRLVDELGRRGHRVRILAAAPSPRLKRNPANPGQTGQVVKDASFVLERHPDRPILLTSSTIDAYGRAALLDPGEAVQERDLLRQVLAGGPPPGELFDTDLMFWLNGWVTLFAAVHVCLGDLYEDGAEVIFSRHRKDPLTAALRRFDRRLLDYYAEIRGDLPRRIERATSAHHLFHAITEEAPVRLHMTRRLLKEERGLPNTVIARPEGPGHCSL
jgi:hypothetical protein